MRTLLLLSLCLLAGAGRSAESQRPNILVILADDMGFSDASCYGGEIPTPNLDRLAAEGVRFTQFYNMARCCPSRAALLTGKYPHQVGVGHMVDTYAKGVRAALGGPAYTDHLSAESPTIAEVLRASGYRTGMAGKWHLGYRREEWPSARGFEQALVQIDGAMNYWGYGIQHNAPVGKPVDPPMIRDGEPWAPPHEGFFTTDAYADFAARFIDDHAKDAAPFFFYLAFNAPHWPLQAPAEDIAAQRPRYEVGYDAIRAARLERLKQLGILAPDTALAPRPPRLPAWEAATAEQRAEWSERMSIYAAQVTRMDAAIGRVLAHLRETSALDRTLVLFLSDNGGAAEDPNHSMPGSTLGSRESYRGYGLPGAHVSSGPFRMYKIFMHEGGIATPCIARWPGKIAQAGGLTREVGDFIDIMATALDAAGAQYPKTFADRETTPVEGVSLLPALRGEALARPQPLFWEHEGNRAVRDGKWKLVSRFPGDWELYDIEADRTELHNLASAEPEKVRDLTAKYDAWAARCDVRPWSLTKRAGQ